MEKGGQIFRDGGKVKKFESPAPPPRQPRHHPCDSVPFFLTAQSAFWRFISVESAFVAFHDVGHYRKWGQEMRLRLLPEAVRALGVPSPRRLPLSSFFSHCQLKERERERETKLRYLCKYAISELIDRTKRHPIFPIFFRSSLDYLSFLILPLIQSIRQRKFF